jgi:RNA polymerase sigma factor (sigma-70 family)
VDTSQYTEYRPLMFSIAYRMTGSVSDAEDIVQEAFLRAGKDGGKDGGKDAEIESPKAYLATITTRLAIDHLRSARVRRESYVGTWLPEPLLASAPGTPGAEPDPAEFAETSDSLSMAFLVLLESLAPAERAVFLLREGLVLRYGYFYGHGASDSMPDIVRKRQMPVIGGGTGIWSFCEITDAAAATAAAITRGAPGLYNIVDDDPAPVREWLPYLAECLGAKPPLRAPAWLGRVLAGQLVVSLMTDARGSVNEKAKRELGWAPAYASWRDGFRDWAKTAEQARAA